MIEQTSIIWDGRSWSDCTGSFESLVKLKKGNNETKNTFVEPDFQKIIQQVLYLKKLN